MLDETVRSLVASVDFGAIVSRASRSRWHVSVRVGNKGRHHTRFHTSDPDTSAESRVVAIALWQTEVGPGACHSIVWFMDLTLAPDGSFLPCIWAALQSEFNL